MKDRAVIRLRTLSEADRARLLVWRSSPDVAENMLSDRPIDPEEHRKWFVGAQIDGAHFYRIVESDGDEPLGLVYLTDLSQRDRSCSWGGYLAETSARGRGFGKLALWLSLQWAFKELLMNKVSVIALADNAIAISLYEGVGFRREAYLRREVWKHDRPRDVVGLALLSSEWEPLEPGIRRQLESRELLW